VCVCVSLSLSVCVCGVCVCGVCVVCVGFTRADEIISHALSTALIK
jgi:hypothetical protein